MCPLFRPLSEIPTLGVGWATEFLSIPYYGRVVPSPQTVANAGNVLICLERGCVADQPQRCDWCFAHSRAPENLNEDTAISCVRLTLRPSAPGNAPRYASQSSAPRLPASDRRAPCLRRVRDRETRDRAGLRCSSRNRSRRAGARG